MFITLPGKRIGELKIVCREFKRIPSNGRARKYVVKRACKELFLANSAVLKSKKVVSRGVCKEE